MGRYRQQLYQGTVFTGVSGIFSLWYAWQSMRCWYPALRLRTICTQHCGRWQLIPLFCVSACSRQVPLRNQSGMLIRTHFKGGNSRGLQYQPGCDVMAISVAVPKNLSGIKTKSSVKSDETPAYLLQRCRCGRDSLLHFYKRVYRHTGIGTFDGSGHAAFFLLAMGEKTDRQRVIPYFMIRQKFLTPGIRPYKSGKCFTED